MSLNGIVDNNYSLSNVYALEPPAPTKTPNPLENAEQGSGTKRAKEGNEEQNTKRIRTIHATTEESCLATALPEKVLTVIFSFINGPQTLDNLSRVCKLFYRLASTDHLWSPLCRQKKFNLVEGKSCKQIYLQNWREWILYYRPRVRTNVKAVWGYMFIKHGREAKCKHLKVLIAREVEKDYKRIDKACRRWGLITPTMPDEHMEVEYKCQKLEDEDSLKKFMLEPSEAFTVFFSNDLNKKKE
jgi:hypothetical protein